MAASTGAGSETTRWASVIGRPLDGPHLVHLGQDWAGDSVKASELTPGASGFS